MSPPPLQILPDCPPPAPPPSTQHTHRGTRSPPLCSRWPVTRVSSKLPTDAACFGLKGPPKLGEPVSWGGDDRAAIGQSAGPSVKGSCGPGKPPNAALPDHTIYEKARKPGYLLTLTHVQMLARHSSSSDTTTSEGPKGRFPTCVFRQGSQPSLGQALLCEPSKSGKPLPRKQKASTQKALRSVRWGSRPHGDQLRMLVHDEAPGEGPFQARGPQDGRKKRGDTSREPSAQRTSPRATDRARRKLPPSQASAPEVRDRGL